MDSSSVSSAVSGAPGSSGARRRTTPRIGGLDSPPYSNISLASPHEAQQEIAYVRSPFRLFSFYGTDRALPIVPDELVTPRIPDTPAIRVVPPRDGPWTDSPPAVVMDRARSSGSSSIYSTDSSEHASHTSSLWTTSVSRSSTQKSDSPGSTGRSLSSATATLVGSMLGRSTKASRPSTRESSRRSTIRSAWSAFMSPKHSWSGRSPTFPISPTPAQISKAAGEPRWTVFKWVLLGSIASLWLYGLIGFGLALTTWMRAWNLSEVVILTDGEVLAYLTVASVLCLLTAAVGLVGAMLNSRPILTFYNILLWPTFIAILSIGYSSYRRSHLGLDRKLNQAWSQQYSDLARLRIQYNLSCCGYYNSLHDATFSKQCYPRSMLPGCKGALLDFESSILRRCWLAAFVVAPFHLINIFAAVLCSNNVNRMFGKRLTPREYRLTANDILAQQQLLNHAQREAVATPPDGMQLDDLESDGEDLPPIPRAPGLHGLGLEPR